MEMNMNMRMYAGLNRLQEAKPKRRPELPTMKPDQEKEKYIRCKDYTRSFLPIYWCLDRFTRKFWGEDGRVDYLTNETIVHTNKGDYFITKKELNPFLNSEDSRLSPFDDYYFLNNLAVEKLYWLDKEKGPLVHKIPKGRISEGLSMGFVEFYPEKLNSPESWLERFLMESRLARKLSEVQKQSMMDQDWISQSSKEKINYKLTLPKLYEKGFSEVQAGYEQSLKYPVCDTIGDKFDWLSLDERARTGSMYIAGYGTPLKAFSKQGKILLSGIHARF